MVGYIAILVGVISMIVALIITILYFHKWWKESDKFKIELARQGNFIVALLMIHFIFYGFVANIYGKSIGEDILFTYKIIFGPRSWFSIFILIVIVFFIVLRETFFEYGIRNSIMLTPFIIGMAWIWYQFIVEFDLMVIPLYFIKIEAYLTIITVLAVNFSTAILASILKQLYNEYIKTSKEIIITEK
jgi:hypothetical protein